MSETTAPGCCGDLLKVASKSEITSAQKTGDFYDQDAVCCTQHPVVFGPFIATCFCVYGCPFSGTIGWVCCNDNAYMALGGPCIAYSSPNKMYISWAGCPAATMLKKGAATTESTPVMQR